MMRTQMMQMRMMQARKMQTRMMQTRMMKDREMQKTSGLLCPDRAAPGENPREQTVRGAKTEPDRV